MLYSLPSVLLSVLVLLALAPVTCAVGVPAGCSIVLGHLDPLNVNIDSYERTANTNTTVIYQHHTTVAHRWRLVHQRR